MASSLQDLQKLCETGLFGGKSVSVTTVKKLTDKHGLEVQLGPSKRTPYLYAAWAGRLDVCKFLVQLRAKEDALDAFGSTALHLASAANFDEQRSLSILKWLLYKRSADLYAFNSFNETAYMAAKKIGRQRIMVQVCVL